VSFPLGFFDGENQNAGRDFPRAGSLETKTDFREETYFLNCISSLSSTRLLVIAQFVSRGVRNMKFGLLAAGLFLTSTLPVLAQVTPAASGGGLPLNIGVAYSDYNSGFEGRGYLGGPTLWVDWNLEGTRFFDGWGLELEGRDLNYERTGSDPKLRQDTVEGGVTYRWGRFFRFQPYGKFLIGYGSMDFTNTYTPTYTHDTRNLWVPGGGVEFRLVHNLIVRGDYEYQIWPDFFDMHPQGVTLGLSYDFAHHAY
jgi:opacity protein-like surface antigen